MPKKQFFNLNKEKQDLILEAAFKEFSKNQFMDASINTIVHESGISRGSFYLYFIDKLDVYLYLTGRILENQSTQFASNINNAMQNDEFSFFRELFKYNINLLSDAEYKHYFKNLYLGMNYEIWSYIRRKQSMIREELFKTLRIKSIGNDKNETSENLIHILEMINRDMITKKIFEELSDEVIISLYDKRVKLIKTKEDILNEK